MRPHKTIQLLQQKLHLALRCIEELDPPAQLGRWFFLGVIPDSYGGQDRWVPACLKGTTRKALVPVLFYYLDHYAPLSIPLICDVYDNKISISLVQPLTILVFPGLNKAKSRILTVYDYFNTVTNEFIWADTPEQDFPLPLRQIPLYRESLIEDTDLTGSYTRGERPIIPLCSMKVGFVDLLFLWPVGLQKPCRYLCANWKVVHRPHPMGKVAVRPFEGEDGCTVITAEEGLEEH
ncbi:uncharacterized protein B0H18DRAFT_962100 [Fomitopsis serialis]|uniref:uncharacterized protein n=1 Tax=Fomitopsis serialis TaxID=139415 RepID=UPI0020078E23|nr:uncharacterized protein B0H18DRAFT_962100 [Neoantrodia serialis]KAH9911588.1 hypothetical protein B0H18DRAFT_962100 [Neoantrodia serialis]